MKRRHAMPFGAEHRADGSTRFRLWAPGATEVTLQRQTVDCSGQLSRTIDRSMRAEGDGWFALVCDAPAGTRYAFRIDGNAIVPDPASRSNPDDVHAPSAVVDPCAYEWQDEAWRGRPWHEAVVYELHIGSFTTQGTFAAATDRLDHLVELGVTAVEIMPVADFPGSRSWGYDGVLLFAPDAAYGTPDDMKRFVDAAHARGLMVLLDVVYNHFGPEGNYLHAYAPAFFNPAHHTPWGAAINFDAEQCATVRDFYIHNALYWLDEFHLDGLRFDAVHAIVDTSPEGIVVELTAAVRTALAGREIHLVLENDRNDAHLLERDAAGRPRQATAQWNDDVHHALHVLVTAETDGYYADYAQAPLATLGRALAEGFAQQGDWSAHRGSLRGERSAHLPPLAFVNFLQNHDQTGNRAFGERITALADPDRLRVAIACLLLSPSPPMLFMGEEFAATTPFLFFCDFGPELATAVTEGRRREFAAFERFGDAPLREQIPDPNARATFEACRLRWDELEREPHRGWLAFYRHCLDVRSRELVPRLASARGGSGTFRVHADALHVRWELGTGEFWHLAVNFGAHAASFDDIAGDAIFALRHGVTDTTDTTDTTDVSDVRAAETQLLPAHSVRVLVERRPARSARQAPGAGATPSASPMTIAR